MAIIRHNFGKFIQCFAICDKIRCKMRNMTYTVQFTIVYYHRHSLLVVLFVKMTAIKRKILDLQDKVDIILKLENGAKQSDICRETGIDKSIVSRIWASKVKLLNKFKLNSGCSRKKMRSCTLRSKLKCVRILSNRK